METVHKKQLKIHIVMQTFIAYIHYHMWSEVAEMN